MLNIEQIKQKVITHSDYQFLNSTPSLGDNIILLTIAGSYSYGLNNDSSDIDVRGCFLNSKRQILTGLSEEKFIDDATDTVLYNLNKMIAMLIGGSPNILEMLATPPECIIKKSSIGQELINMRTSFLSKNIIAPFRGYACSQKNKIENAKLAVEPSLEEYYQLKKKVCKNMVNIIRLYAECIQILKEGDFSTYRYNEHNILMSLRCGEYIYPDLSPRPEFYTLEKSFSQKFEEAVAKTKLPDSPDIEKIFDFVEAVNYKKVIGNV